MLMSFQTISSINYGNTRSLIKQTTFLTTRQPEVNRAVIRWQVTATTDLHCLLSPSITAQLSSGGRTYCQKRRLLNAGLHYQSFCDHSRNFA
jgi:hypothetical protein